MSFLMCRIHASTYVQYSTQVCPGRVPDHPRTLRGQLVEGQSDRLGRSGNDPTGRGGGRGVESRGS